MKLTSAEMEFWQRCYASALSAEVYLYVVDNRSDDPEKPGERNRKAYPWEIADQAVTKMRERIAEGGYR